MENTKNLVINLKESNMENVKKYICEMVGTLVLTLFGCGSAAIAGAALGPLGIAMAFGLSIVAMAFAIGQISGCHINPAVTLGMFIDKRIGVKDMVCYWVAQFIGAILGAFLLAFIILQCPDLGKLAKIGLGCNAFGEASISGISMWGAIIVEIVLTFVFVLTVLGVTSNNKTGVFAGIVIGLSLVFVHILGVELTGTSVNPARSFGPALVMAIMAAKSMALSQVWVFILAPLAGGALAAGFWRFIKVKKDTKPKLEDVEVEKTVKNA